MYGDGDSHPHKIFFEPLPVVQTASTGEPNLDQLVPHDWNVAGGTWHEEMVYFLAIFADLAGVLVFFL